MGERLIMDINNVETNADIAADAEAAGPASAAIRQLGSLGVEAIGSIAPAVPPVVDIGAAELGDILDSVYRPTDEQVIAACIDGRSAIQSQALSPNAAGGSLALWAALLLSGPDIRFEDFLAGLKAAGIGIGGHTDDHAHGASSGCGANDKLQTILELIAATASSQRIAVLAASLGVVIDEQDAARLAERAAELAGGDGLGTATERLALLRCYGDVSSLCGAHNEQLIVINAVQGTTLDRFALSERFGERAAVFNVDSWAFEPSLLAMTNALGFQDLDLQNLLAALTAFNLGCALALCDSCMPVALRTDTGR